MCKFYGLMDRIEMLDKIVQFCLRMLPDKEDIIYNELAALGD